MCLQSLSIAIGGLQGQQPNLPRALFAPKGGL